jgi:hypothetical protein
MPPTAFTALPCPPCAGRAPDETRVLRGGSWNNNPSNLRSANRNRNAPDNRNNNNGFRLAQAAGRALRPAQSDVRACLGTAHASVARRCPWRPSASCRDARRNSAVRDDTYPCVTDRCSRCIGAGCKATRRIATNGRLGVRPREDFRRTPRQVPIRQWLRLEATLVREVQSYEHRDSGSATNSCLRSVLGSTRSAARKDVGQTRQFPTWPRRHARLHRAGAASPEIEVVNTNSCHLCPRGVGTVRQFGQLRAIAQEIQRLVLSSLLFHPYRKLEDRFRRRQAI